MHLVIVKFCLIQVVYVANCDVVLFFLSFYVEKERSD
jgi:hypothetical protein